MDCGQSQCGCIAITEPHLQVVSLDGCICHRHVHTTVYEDERCVGGSVTWVAALS
jgi:hypothetical protein